MTAQPSPHNLPIPSTTFLGREKELEDIQALLGDPDCRLLSLVGPGGAGKSRLSIATGRAVLERFPEGVFFVPLAPLSSEEVILSAVAESVRFTQAGSRPPASQIFNFLADKRMLIILDNFEHLIGGAELLGQLIEKTDSPKFLVTTRNRLKLPHERILEVGGLEIPQSDFQSVSGNTAYQLFVQTAQRLFPDFIISDADRPQALRICRLVDGMPLGIELAASWAKVLSCREIAASIEHNLDFLNTLSRDMPERHRSLRAVFEYSWSLLTREEQNFYRRLAVFRAHFRKEAAQYVTGVTPYLLETYVDKSLLRRLDNGRYEMHELIRRYSKEKMRESAMDAGEVVERFCAYYADFVHKLEGRLRDEHRLDSLRLLGEESENIREAWRLAAETGRRNDIDRSLGCLFHYWETTGRFQEGRELVGKALETLPPAKKGRGGSKGDLLMAKLLARQGGLSLRLGLLNEAKLVIQKGNSLLPPGRKYDLERAFNLVWLAWTQSMLGEYKQSIRNYRASQKLFRAGKDLSGAAWSLMRLGKLQGDLGRHKKGLRLLTEALGIFKKLDEGMGLANVLNNMGAVLENMGRYPEAQASFQDGLAMFTALNDKGGIATSHSHLGQVHFFRGELEVGEEFCRKAQSLFREVANLSGMAWASSNLGRISLARGDWELAKKFFEDGLEKYWEIGERRGAGWALGNLGDVMLALGESDRALELFRQSLEIYMEIDDPQGLAWSNVNAGRASRASGRLKEAREFMEAAWKICRGLEDREGLTRCQFYLGHLALDEGNREEARKLFYESFQTAVKDRAVSQMLRALTGVARLLALDGEGEKASEILAFVLQFPSKNLVATEAKIQAKVLVRELKLEIPDMQILGAAKFRQTALAILERKRKKG